jgi:flagellar biosynthesis protein FlhF
MTLRRPLIFVGPPGAGKTLTVARLATRLVMAKTPPEVLTGDTRRTGAYEQLAAYTDLLGIALRRVGDGCPSGAPVLIDAPGLDPFDAADRDELAELVGLTGALPVLVLPGGIDAGEALDLAEAFAGLGAARLVATRLDIARRIGGILAAATKLPLAEAGISSAAPAGLVPMTPDLLARRLLRTAHRSDT